MTDMISYLLHQITYNSQKLAVWLVWIVLTQEP